MMLRLFLRDFVGFKEEEKHVKEEKGDQTSLFSLLCFSSLPYFPFFFRDSWWYYVTKFDLVEGNRSLRINNTVISNLVSLFNLCFEYWMFCGVYFSWLSRLITRRPTSLLFVAIYRYVRYQIRNYLISLICEATKI